ncbi:MAG: 16S rRNA (guanine(527)-N(7))-methyltransferase RsmG [Ruminococcus sp.]|nr:16S rRNA (guanine(527)-N(7))-methyltransferase RsmG [Candidatus Copronaster equi]
MIDTPLLKLEAEKIGILLDETALKRFDKYAEMIVETNKYLNLTAITEPTEMLYKHFIDSLSLLTVVKLQQGAKVIDIGTGAGFPGVVLLIARPDLKITLMDGTNKRLNFITQVLDELKLNAEILHSRAELAGKDKKYREKFDLVTARAVANMNTLSEYCLPFSKVGGIFAPMKAAKAEEEIKDSENAIKLLGGRIKEVRQLNIESCGERCIIITEKISQTPSKYPRASAQISKKPLA